MSWKLAVLVLLLNVVIIRTLDNGLARTPPMGWMQWQRFRCNIDCVNDPHYCVRFYVAGYSVMGSFLNKTGRPILYACSWPVCMGKNLIIGDYGLSETQQKVQMGMWAMMASPLFMSVDLRNIDPRAKKLLLNKQVLAINQDPLGKQGMRVWIDTTGTLEYWTRPLMSNGSYAIAILNTSDYGMSRHINCTLKDFKLPSANSYLITDIFGGENLGKFGLSDRIVLQLHPTDIFLATAVPMSFS
ncbi:hypothetical protein KUTeg_024698 [Tegillarca granosa]|uniref:alpha-galactosidase n=1 Tax=Tegillarca granosa TaxID=220873 RepID=A0ABQ9E3K5_TEGGR|nr:hypothetical protein KUTeg_024698 [Tegillarca granosa]